MLATSLRQFHRVNALRSSQLSCSFRHVQSRRGWKQRDLYSPAFCSSLSSSTFSNITSFPRTLYSTGVPSLAFSRCCSSSSSSFSSLEQEREQANDERADWMGDSFKSDAVEECLQSVACKELIQNAVLPNIARGATNLVGDLEFRYMDNTAASRGGLGVYLVKGQYHDGKTGKSSGFKCLLKIFTDLEHPELLLCDGKDAVLPALNKHVRMSPLTYAVTPPPGGAVSESLGKRWLFREWLEQGYADHLYPSEVYVAAASKLGVMSGLSFSDQLPPLPANLRGFKYADEIAMHMGHTDLSRDPPEEEGKLAFPSDFRIELKKFLDVNMNEMLELVNLLPHTLSHGDFHQRNFLAQPPSPENQMIVEVVAIDWELAYMRPVCYDLVKMMALGPPTTFHLNAEESGMSAYVQELFSSFLESMTASVNKSNQEMPPSDIILFAFVLLYVLALPGQLATYLFGEEELSGVRKQLGSVYESTRASRLELANGVGVYNRTMFKAFTELWPLRAHPYFESAKLAKGGEQAASVPSHLTKLDPSILAMFNVLNSIIQAPTSMDLETERKKILMVPSSLAQLGPRTPYHVFEIGDKKAALYVPRTGEGELKKITNLSQALEVDQSFGKDSPLFVWCPADLLVSNCYGIQNPMCRTIADAFDVRVLAPSLPTCPEARANQLHTAVRELVQDIKEPLILGGVGFGAHVAVGAAYELLKAGRAIKGLFLTTPAVDLKRLVQSESLSLYGDFFSQSRLRLEWLWSLYAEENSNKPMDMIEMFRELASGPLRDTCASVPIILLTAEFDAMRDENLVLGKELKSFWPGPVVWKHESTLCHGYFANPGFKCAARCAEEVAVEMRKLGF